jgi:hypothetical protein
MTEHESLTNVKLVIPVNVLTESHPEDIDEKTMKDIVASYLLDALENMVRNGDLPVLTESIKGWDFEDIKMTDTSSTLISD